MKMKSKPIVVPSLLSADFSMLGEEILAVEKAGADWLHLDVMDGHFVPNITVGLPVLDSLKRVTKMPFDVHLMIEQPERYVETFCRVGADLLTVHVETVSDPLSVSKKIRSLGSMSGLTLKPSTSVERVLPFLADFDLILVMTVEPGFSGQSFMMDQVQKIQRISSEIERLGLDTFVEVDGGINASTAKICREAGADVFVSGNFIFKGNYQKAIESIKNL